jgi:superfamily I DNA/RNA helicase
METTPEQEFVIGTVNDNLVVLAGPGSGKTFTITEKILRLFKDNVVQDPFGVLAITFTNAAANEMRFRLQSRGFRSWDRIFVGTYHSFSNYLLSCYGGDIGIREDFNVADSDKQNQILNTLLTSHPRLSVSNIKSTLEGLKRQGIYPGIKDERLNDELREIYESYQTQLNEQNLIDFADSIAYATRLLENSPLVYRLFSTHYRYLLVDEFQDTDSQQLKLVEILAENAKGVTIVADDDQSIFGWRGANRKNVEIIAKDIGAVICQLGVNFRSDQVIVQAANLVIQQEPNRINKNIRAASSQSGKIYYKNFNDENQEGQSIANQINSLIAQGELSDLGQIAIIARARWRTNILTQALDAFNLNWFDRSKLSFEDSWDALLAIGILGLSLNLDSSDELYNVMSTIETSGLAHQFSIQDALDLAITIHTDLKSNLDCALIADNVKSILAAANYWQLIKTSSWSPTEIENRLRNTERMIDDLVSLAKQANLDLKDSINRLAGIGAIQILSGQESKGREFSHVFFIGLEEGLIPDRRATQEELIAEERRIFYVGLTRTKRIAYLTTVSQRTPPWGGIQSVKPSRFLQHIPPELLSEFP